jgi:hypothetical protein
MEKRAVMMGVTILLLGLAVVPLAAHDNEQEKSIGQILILIRQEQGISTNDRIDPDKVSDKLLEELGDAVMSLAHPNQGQHEWMDQIMGGEGSESLEAMHRAMGYGFLQHRGWEDDSFMNQDNMGPGSRGHGMMGDGNGPMMGR